MTERFRIGVDWLSPGEPPFEDPTAAMLRIEVDEHEVTRAENRWSQTVVQAVPLSAEPLALWLAASWWRLCWEPERPAGAVSPGWRMAHEVGAAGAGFLWPRVCIAGDGETIKFDAVPTSHISPEMLRYLADFRLRVPLKEFETGVERFIDLVIERLSGWNSPSDLPPLWRAVQRERDDPNKARVRRAEAVLGYDPDEVPPAMLNAVLAIAADAGEAALPEIAAICASHPPEAVRAAEQAATLRGRFSDTLRCAAGTRTGLPHERGYAAAAQLRGAIGLAEHAPVPTKTLAELMGLTTESFEGFDGDPAAPISLALREDDQDRFLLRRRHQRGRRFEAGRLIGDVLSHAGERWHAAADTTTARQKMQRAFAAEFLAPVSALKAALDGDLSEDAIEDAATRFEVGELLIRSQLVNQGIVPRTPWAAAT